MRDAVHTAMCVCACVSVLHVHTDAEMLWCQAVGALFVGMLSELVYTSILGMLAGAAYGAQHMDSRDAGFVFLAGMFSWLHGSCNGNLC